MAFKRYDGYVNSVPQRMIDSSLPICPFCRSSQPHWLLDNKLDLMGGRTLYRCERCEATMSGRAIDAAADGGKQFAFNVGYAAMNAAEKGRKGQEVGVRYFRVEELGKVCTNAALLSQELPLNQLQAMAGMPMSAADAQPVQPPVQEPAPAPQPVQQPVHQQPPVQPQQPVYQRPAYQQPSVERAEVKKSGVSLAPPILSLIFALLAFLTGYLVNPIIMSSGVPAAPVVLVFAVFRILFTIPSLVLGIIGLIKSIKYKKLAGIILAALGLLLSLYVLIMAFTAISNLLRYAF